MVNSGMTKLLFILLFLTMGCEPLIFYYISSSSIEQKISKIVPLQESKKEVVVPNKKLESKKWAKFIVGSMHYYGDGREKDKRKLNSI